MQVEYDNPVLAAWRAEDGEYVWSSPVHVKIGDFPLPLEYRTRDADATFRARMFSFGNMCGAELIERDGHTVARQVWRQDAIADPSVEL